MSRRVGVDDSLVQARMEQIQSFLDRVAAKEDFAVIGELILTPVSGAESYNKAVRISSAIDVFVSQ